MLRIKDIILCNKNNAGEPDGSPARVHISTVLKSIDILFYSFGLHSTNVGKRDFLTQ